MVIGPPKRPDEAINILINALQPLGERIHVIARKRIGWGTREKPYIYLVIEGEVSVLRLSDGLMLGSTREPHVLGFTEMFFPVRSNQIRAETECTLIRIDASRVISEIDRLNLWRAVAELSTYHTTYMVYRDLQIVNQRTPPVVYQYLQEMDQLPDEQKHRINILSYIQERTGLSRSSILNVVAWLKKHKYIDYQRGGYHLKVNNLPN
ncbi:helix-turn-helix domain-containing protein [Scandinavium sp. V105_16]|uniref:Helix-turn-helix domain-containing protein n=1 Tax=Scandinavium lactucae TaxID=3095028 RepID=A0AAJ2RXQ8_9ENTR|nr:MULTISPECIES: helix-turn-helix domain-containing protein [unclassified Scandinavium]MDX6018933.1 helix-turn-helix domain-containing protein [Scandinavium sp. V105_16]MDX6030105.1 helix-turn-helix domain-containing protein [Scandinavium sp. V105_12]MDX6039235.1 helix-turn-helix domain-containing protein [Scandinavium sp. V105_6]MDX6050306.1 helix-turn-helix domain-containing protein [Scandinavium sp. V105_1]